MSGVEWVGGRPASPGTQWFRANERRTNDMRAAAAALAAQPVGAITAPGSADLLRGLYRCQHSEPGGICHAKGITYDPAAGHVPRGYAGATGHPSEVRLILVVAEPSQPVPDETYSDASGEGMHHEVRDQVHDLIRKLRDPFHVNLQHLLALCFPGDGWDVIMRKAWVTESVLCSLSRERRTGEHPKKVRTTCVETWLLPQIALFPRAAIVLAGAKARDRVKPYLIGSGRHYRVCRVLAPPASNYGRDWGETAAWFNGLRLDGPLSQTGMLP